MNDDEEGEIELGGKVIKFHHLEKSRRALASAYGLCEADVQMYLKLRSLCDSWMNLLDQKKVSCSDSGNHRQPSGDGSTGTVPICRSAENKNHKCTSRGYP